MEEVNCSQPGRGGGREGEGKGKGRGEREIERKRMHNILVNQARTGPGGRRERVTSLVVTEGSCRENYRAADLYEPDTGGENCQTGSGDRNTLTPAHRMAGDGGDTSWMNVQ